MKKFTSVKDIPSIKKALETAFEVKNNPFGFQHLGKNKTMVLVFFNSSLRTRLSTQKAAMNLGMNTMVMNVNEDSWQLESEMGVVMDGNNAEHLREAIPVIGKYCDVIGVRAFAKFESREADYSEKILSQFVEYAGVPVVSMEAATRHPLQSFADLVTIEEHKTVERPKVVLTWAPHPRALPQAVANSFVEWMCETDYELVVTHPKGYELASEFMGDVKVEYDQKKAFEGADFIYAKNWASYTDYGKILSKDMNWTVNEEKMALTNNAKFMHCLPVRRNVVVSDGVIDSPNSIVVDQAKNREVTAQAVLKMILENS
ncbi:N-acetylornithine carbamoyltransferase [Prolixibacteraceae bacterium Z1-6]|uniref:N-succinylornithine carbamoyltransferase n=1 Tax=Draconibacterium aestuarii TaxID=2998507 RepID=A0A9X3F4V5_9BACT|nr:N-acetylornithine carbamoyltransferase [Prolixibacteraceae bacterium Z1-6]